MAGIGANIFAGGGASASTASSGTTTPTVSNSTPTYGAPTSAGNTSSLHPGTPFGMAVWWGAGGLLVLWLIRSSLPR